LAVGGPPAELAARRRAIAPMPWTWLRQVHGARVVVVGEPGQWAGADADAAVTAVPGAALAVHTADCVPVVLAGDGVVGVAHAGWRGLAAGVVEATAAALDEIGPAGEIRATIGPCIRVECYAFGPDDLDRVAAVLGDGVRGTTSTGAPALDLTAAVGAALERAGVTEVADDGSCTACGRQWFSHRARRDRGRQAAVAWLEPV
jgi:YfiH family protein